MRSNVVRSRLATIYSDLTCSPFFDKPPLLKNELSPPLLQRMVPPQSLNQPEGGENLI